MMATLMTTFNDSQSDDSRADEWTSAVEQQRSMSETEIFCQRFEYRRGSAASSRCVVADPGEPRLDDYASSLAVLPDAVSLG